LAEGASEVAEIGEVAGVVLPVQDLDEVDFAILAGLHLEGQPGPSLEAAEGEGRVTGEDEAVDGLDGGQLVGHLCVILSLDDLPRSSIPFLIEWVERERKRNFNAGERF
jgi:hypothetical protein